MKNRYKYFITLIVVAIFSFSNQYMVAQDRGILSRLQAVSNVDSDFYNVDGVKITYEVIKQRFTMRNILHHYGQFIPEGSALEHSDSTISQQNFVYERIDSICERVNIYTTYYFIEESAAGITVITYSSPGKDSKEIQQELNPLLLGKKIPESVFNKMIFNSINFAGRKIELGTYAAQWTNVNCVQWPYNGEMSWSIHRDQAGAALSVEMQRRITAENNSKEFSASLVSDEMVNVLFEGVPVVARKVVYKPEGEIAAKLASTSDGETMVIYYVTAFVRNNWVSCMMSHWSNDAIGESGLPVLLEKVMTLR
ncbi:MAG: hypothetical protein LBV72_16000 [Tannerella sp.]|jgi:hypothetical protein|nr:hypothetical protein [Tannerella sp.]